MRKGNLRAKKTFIILFEVTSCLERVTPTLKEAPISELEGVLRALSELRLFYFYSRLLLALKCFPTRKEAPISE